MSNLADELRTYDWNFELHKFNLFQQLTETVRSKYNLCLMTAFEKNLHTWFENNGLDLDLITPNLIKGSTQLLEYKVLESCMMSSIYEFSMNGIISQIEKCTDSNRLVDVKNIIEILQSNVLESLDLKDIDLKTFAETYRRHEKTEENKQTINYEVLDLSIKNKSKEIDKEQIVNETTKTEEKCEEDMNISWSTEIQIQYDSLMKSQIRLMENTHHYKIIKSRFNTLFGEDSDEE